MSYLLLFNKDSFPIEMYWANEYPTLFFVDSQSEIFIHKPFDNITQKEIQSIMRAIDKSYSPHPSLPLSTSK
jgi:hypothetical protein